MKLVHFGAAVLMAVLSACSNQTLDEALAESDVAAGVPAEVFESDSTAVSPAADPHPEYDRAYRVTIKNLTSGQPFSPGVAVVHESWQKIFQRGRFASEGIRYIAELGDPSVAIKELSGAEGIFHVHDTAAPIRGGKDLSFEVPGMSGYSRLSISLMLICTNDGFAGLQSARLPRYKHYPVTYYARGYDAGTEYNDEKSTSIVDPCNALGPVAFPNDGDFRTPTKERVKLHRGVEGVGDLTKAHAWDEPVAKVTIERIK
jgi:hypothetical protein